MKSLSFRIVAATTIVFLTALVCTFLVLIQEAKYGFFRVQRNSLTVQAETLAASARLVDGKPSFELGKLADAAGKNASYALLDAGGRVLRSFGLRGIDISPDIIERYDTSDPFGFSLERIFDPNSKDPVILVLPDSETGEQRVTVTKVAHDGLMVQVSMPLFDSRIALVDVLYTFTEATAVVAILPLVLAIIAIQVVVWSTLRPVRDVSREAGEIGPATLDRRLSLDRVPSEMRGLVLTFNDLLARLDAAWRLQREFTANAAHELRTPIAALRAEVEAAVPAQARSVLAIQFNKVARLLAQLLALAEADSRPIDAAGRFDLMALAREVVADMAPAVIASGREISLEREGDKPGTATHGDPGLAEIALRNLIDNAVRHSGPKSEIRVIIDGARLSVANSGSEIQEEARTTMFERFWKQDRRSSGSGLGLSIVDAIMKRLGGTVDVGSGGGTVTFTLGFRSNAGG